jgi:hypothetical protein
MDKSKITSGLLSDYSVELVEIAPFNGVLSDTNYVDASTWVKLYCSIYDARINNLISLETPETVAEQFKNATAANNAVPLAVMHYTYDKLDDEAYNKGWVTYTNGQIREVSGKPAPYLKKNLFAIAPQNLFFEGGTISFAFKSGLIFRNTTQSITKLEINFNNESGYQTINTNSSLSHTFLSGGEKTIFFKFTYSDGSAYTSRTRIYVNIDTSGLRAGESPFIEDSVFINPREGYHSGGIYGHQNDSYRNKIITN